MTDVPWRRYESKPSVIEAIQWTGDNWREVWEFGRIKVRAVNPNPDGSFELQLMAGKDGTQGWVWVPIGHWIVGNPGDFSDLWPINNEHFAANYQELGESL